MKTPNLNNVIQILEALQFNSSAQEMLAEYKAIKSIIETHSNKENSKRYFIVSFSGLNNIGTVVGFADISTDGGFLNLKTTIEYIKERQGIKECVITNIMEISEQDFNDWNN